MQLDIYNFRRSKPQWETLVLRVSFKTSLQQLDELKHKMNAYVEEERVDFIDGVSVNISNFTDLETMIIKVSFCHRTNWQVCSIV